MSRLTSKYPLQMNAVSSVGKKRELTSLFVINFCLCRIGFHTTWRVHTIVKQLQKSSITEKCSLSDVSWRVRISTYVTNLTYITTKYIPFTFRTVSNKLNFQSFSWCWQLFHSSDLFFSWLTCLESGYVGHLKNSLMKLFAKLCQMITTPKENAFFVANILDISPQDQHQCGHRILRQHTICHFSSTIIARICLFGHVIYSSTDAHCWQCAPVEE